MSAGKVKDTKIESRKWGSREVKEQGGLPRVHMGPVLLTKCTDQIHFDAAVKDMKTAALQLPALC